MDPTDELLQCDSPEEQQGILADLFQRSRDRLKRMVHYRIDERLRGRIDSSDVIQEAFLEASRRLDEYIRSPEVSLFLWVRFLAAQKLQILHRHHLGVQARDARREVSLYHGAMPQASSQALAAQLMGEDTSPSEAALRAERKIYLQEALNSLDPVDREILVLRSFEQLSSRETAQVLGIKEGAARQRYFRALARLKSLLDRAPGPLKEEDLDEHGE